MRQILFRDFPPLADISTLKKAKSMMIIQPSLLLPTPKTTKQLLLKILPTNYTHPTLKACLRIVNLNKNPTKASELAIQWPFFKIQSQSNLLNKQPANKPRCASTVKNARTTGIARCSTKITQIFLPQSRSLQQQINFVFQLNRIRRIGAKKKILRIV